jgi:hypothetical protein
VPFGNLRLDWSLLVFFVSLLSFCNEILEGVIMLLYVRVCVCVCVCIDLFIYALYVITVVIEFLCYSYFL